MFTPKDDVKWWAQRVCMNRKLLRYRFRPEIAEIAKSNYGLMLTAAFTVLFNESQKKGSYHGN